MIGVPGGQYSTMMIDDQVPGVTLLIGKLPAAWLHCQTDADCAISKIGCGDVALNKDHLSAFEARMLPLGLRPDATQCQKFSTVFPATRTLIARCMTTTQTAAANVKVAPEFLKQHPEVKIEQGIRVAAANQCNLDYSSENR